jgi:hypothetical protein
VAAASKAKKQTKSGAIRAYAAKHPSAGPTEISKALTKQGIKVSPAHVSNVRSTTASKAKRGKRTSKPASDAVSLVQLVEARRFAEHVGGVGKAVELLKSLERLLA